MKKSRLIISSLIHGWTKFNPFELYKNPVIFVTALGALLLTLNQLIYVQATPFSISITLWLWFTAYFANAAEAMAEVRNQAHADALKSARQELFAHKISEEGDLIHIKAFDLKPGDQVFIYKDELIPADGEVLLGSVLIDESSFTGESEPVIRTAGTDCNSVMAGTKVLSEEAFIRIASEQGTSQLDKMIQLIESAKRKKTPNEQALSILLNSLTLLFLSMILTLQLFGTYFSIHFSLVTQVSLFVCLIPTTIGGLLSAVSIAGINRLLKKNVIAMSGQAIESAGDVNIILFDKTGTITTGNRRAHAFYPDQNVDLDTLLACAFYTSCEDTTTEGRSILELLEKEHPAPLDPLPKEYTFVPFAPETRLCGIDTQENSYRKGSLDAMEAFTNTTLSLHLKKIFEQIASQGGTPLIVGMRDKIFGIIALKDTIKEGITDKFSRFRALGIKTVMMTGDNPLTAQTVAHEVGVDDFLASISPEAKLKQIQSYQKKGMIVAMTGDGVNDAPALAHADVSMAMNAGTQTAKEAANLIDLDSQPTKLFDVIEVGKQMLMTRGSLTTFSLANDLAKYFVILPAMLTPYFPFFNLLNLMHLSTPQSALLSAVIYNALIIIALLPLAFKGVKLIPAPATTLLNRNLLIYGLGGVILPFIGIKLIDLILTTL